MSKEFEIVREFAVDAEPQQVWDAFTTGTAGWLWPMEYEEGEGGGAPFGGSVTVWDPPHRLVDRVEDPALLPPVQSLNQLERVIEPREGGGSWVRYVHSGIFVEDWDSQYDGAAKHTDFYLHTLRQYLEHFTGRPATHSSAEGPAASGAPGSLDAVGRALGLADGAQPGGRVRVELPGAAPFDAVVDYRNAYFLGLRGEDALYRFFGRGAWGAPVEVVVHGFGADADPKETGRVWQEWINGVFA
ncbi:SRPBCC domain-containing protein [Streptomyces pathocidini]|uniref:SRPBCC domain-containing protein n=1 Tax=Streptomyces pathocidini TaxID=1650571 RepID=A0ABW7UT58_9ACTN|nr:SRPBCC domain-containing protein [Streptomyces pathocidini]